MGTGQRVRSINLLSGGLDSMLAVRVLQDQGVWVTALTFTTPFFGADRARRSASQLGCELLIMDITDEHLDMVKRPRHGYGKYMNPCIDCHAMMLKKAGGILQKDGYDLIATGEVLGERPMSQNRKSLDIVARESGFADLILRPLSAKLLPPTFPERSGLVDRGRLLSIKGRSRRPQVALAKGYGIDSYVQPAGGCLLADPAFSRRLSDLLKTCPDATAYDVRLLKLGRHFRLPSGARVVVGRDERDNGRISDLADERGVLLVSDIIPGPTAYVLGAADVKDIELAGGICASYADHGGGDVEMECISQGGHKRILAAPLPRKEFVHLRI